MPEGLTVLHGAYVANMCMGCHGAGLSGGKIPGGPPDWPAAANLTPGQGSAMLRYADTGQFTALRRTGKRPDGSAVSKVMPFETLGKFSDMDAGALYLYLKSVAPRPAGERRGRRPTPRTTLARRCPTKRTLARRYSTTRTPFQKATRPLISAAASLGSG